MSVVLQLIDRVSFRIAGPSFVLLINRPLNTSQKTNVLRNNNQTIRIGSTMQNHIDSEHGRRTFLGLPISSDVTKVNVATYLLGCMASVMFLVFLNASQVLILCCAL